MMGCHLFFGPLLLALQTFRFLKTSKKLFKAYKRLALQTFRFLIMRHGKLWNYLKGKIQLGVNGYSP